MSVEADVRAAFKELLARPIAYAPATIHHPNCATMRSGDLRDCECGGWAFPVPGR